MIKKVIGWTTFWLFLIGALFVLLIKLGAEGMSWLEKKLMGDKDE